MESRKRAPGALRLRGSSGGHRGAPGPTNRRALPHQEGIDLFADDPRSLNEPPQPPTFHLRAGRPRAGVKLTAIAYSRPASQIPGSGGCPAMWNSWGMISKRLLEVDEKDWTSQVPGGLAGTYDTSKKKYVALFSSVNTMIGYPLDASPTTISFRMPSNAAGVRFLAGGIGRSGGIEGQDGKYYGSWDQLVCAPGRHDDGNLLPGSAHVMPGDGSHHPAGQIE